MFKIAYFVEIWTSIGLPKIDTFNSQPNLSTKSREEFSPKVQKVEEVKKEQHVSTSSFDSPHSSQAEVGQ
jgi:hypothetical protein